MQFSVPQMRSIAVLQPHHFHFQIKTANNGAVVGAITKKWGGCCREAFTDADTFMVGFPGDLDVKLKGVLLGATFLIDFMEFEQKSQNRNNGI
uniref:Phospholipid scramblase n=1 Tax=Caenorhabditis japonica TaxID=281687 RepID=A0A8R1I7W1_CAEJA